MGNVYKDLLTLESQKQTKPMELFAAQNKGLETQKSLAKTKYDVVSSAPKEKDADIALLQSLRQKLGTGPMRGWRAAMDGLLTGLEHGAKSHVNAQKMEDARKMIETFSGFEGIANAAQKRNEWYAKRAQLEEEITPELEAFTENLGQISPYDATKTAEGFIGRYNQAMGTHYKIDMIDQQNRKILLTDPDGLEKKMDLYQAFPGIRQKQTIQGLERKAIQTQEEQDARASQQININQQNADMMKERLDFAKDPTAQHDVTLGKEQAKEMGKKQAKLMEQNLELEDVSYKIQDLKDILKTGEVITGETLGADFERMLGKNFGTKAYSDTQLYDSVSKGLLSFVKGNVAFGNMNQKEFEFLETQTPGSHKTKAALERMLGRFEKTLDRQIKRNDREIHAVPSYGTRNQEPQNIMPTRNSTSNNEPMVRMTAPDGTPILIPQRNVDLAISQGAIPVE